MYCHFSPLPAPPPHCRRNTVELNAISRDGDLSDAYLAGLETFAAEMNTLSTKGDDSVPVLNLDVNENRDTIQRGRALWALRRESSSKQTVMQSTGRVYKYLQFCTCDELCFLDSENQRRLVSAPETIHICTSCTLPKYGRASADDLGEEGEEGVESDP